MPDGNQHRVRDAILQGIRRINVWFTLLAYTVLAPFGCVCFALLCILWRRDSAALARRLQRVQVFAYRFMHDWLRLTTIARFNHRQALEGMPPGSCVVIANHPTLMDITAITAVLGGGCTIVKPAMFRRRLLHRLLVGAGHIEGPGSDLISIGRAVDEAVGRLWSGFSVIVFPEGTRSPAGELLPFGRTPFEIACRAGVPLVSLTVECNPAYLSKEVPLLRPPHPTPVLRLNVLAVDDPGAVGNDSRRLCRKAEARYRSWFRACSVARRPAYDAKRKERRCQISSKTG